jgi:hypothetical protein
MNVEAYIKDDELRALDRRIDERLESFELLRASRRVALKNVLHAFDVLIQNSASQTHLAQRGLNYSGTYNALDHAVRWIYKYCPEHSDEVPDDAQLRAIELITAGLPSSLRPGVSSL